MNIIRRRGGSWTVASDLINSHLRLAISFVLRMLHITLAVGLQAVPRILVPFLMVFRVAFLQCTDEAWLTKYKLRLCPGQVKYWYTNHTRLTYNVAPSSLCQLSEYYIK